MGSFSIWHWLIVLAVLLLLFGRGKIPDLMGDVAKGIKNFKKGMADDEPETTTVRERRSLEHNDGDVVVHDVKTEKSVG
ncbi:twin-arginine translocase TatA/TatE family subunit [Jiella sp. M17.18]|uniref:twin-arginine translocase TatA/TatE family subunit n=1 Tax=Jiella sp. M17.18 TaxID=3234247 RepID=UPI0034E04372